MVTSLQLSVSRFTATDHTQVEHDPVHALDGGQVLLSSAGSSYISLMDNSTSRAAMKRAPSD